MILALLLFMGIQTAPLRSLQCLPRLQMLRYKALALLTPHFMSRGMRYRVGWNQEAQM